MRRGLIARSVVELPDAVLQARLDRVRDAMATAQLDALVIYTNNTRTAGVSWLTGFVPYWSEALLVVPRQASPVLVAALSFRVKAWIERTSRIGEVLHAPRVGLKAGQQIAAARSDAAVGVVDFDGLACGIADDFREGGGPKLRLGDASALYAKLRGKADPAEIALAAKAVSIARHALGVASGNDLNAIVADVESAARNLGAEEIYIAVAPDLEREARFRRIEGTAAPGRDFALRATVAYKGTWVRLVRAVCETASVRDATARLAEAVAQLPSDHGFSGFGSWLIEGTRTTQPLEALRGSRIGGSSAALPGTLLPGALVSVQGAAPIAGRLVPVGAPALLGESGEAASLLVDPQFD
jgi:Creatinase/Prolidase N-terminal domain